MSRDESFVLDIQAASSILTDMVAPLIKQSGESITNRARSMASSMTSDPPNISVTHTVGTIRKGRRAIATIKSSGKDAHANYIGYMALRKSMDAGRV